VAAALQYAEGDGRLPAEIELLAAVDRYGSNAVFGRVVGAGEIRRMNAAENTIRAYRDREQSDDWPKWARDNPGLARLLAIATKAADDE